MIYLSLSIVAAIILVGLAIRRLPYLRTSRLGLEIASPRPYVARSSRFSGIWQRVSNFSQGMMRKRTMSDDDSPQTPGFSQSYMSAVPNPVEVRSFASTTALPESSSVAHPGDFWVDENSHSSGPLQIPTKGLITRRGESQKIAHELISQADDAFRKKDFTTAEKYYLQAATKDPDNARIYNRLGVIYLQMKNYKDAVEAFRGAVRFDDRVASRHYNLALAYLGRRDYRSADRSLKEAIRQDPTNEKYRKTLDAIQRQPV
jgi:TolA-binding protein